MKKPKDNYSDEPIGEIKIIEDFLPKPEDLVLKEETTKITISLTKFSLDFFKNEANKHHTHYQTMIRSLIDEYANHYCTSMMSTANKMGKKKQTKREKGSSGRIIFKSSPLTKKALKKTKNS